jgi:hypothetical protein
MRWAAWGSLLPSGTPPSIAPMAEDNRLAEVIAGLTQGALGGFKINGGVLRAVVPISIVGLAAIAATMYAFHGPWYAVVGLAVLIIGYMLYASERAYRYAKADPISALLGGSEFYTALRDQMAARNPEIMLNAVYCADRSSKPGAIGASGWLDSFMSDSIRLGQQKQRHWSLRLQTLATGCVIRRQVGLCGLTIPLSKYPTI